jgi:hypothetical protein
MNGNIDNSISSDILSGDDTEDENMADLDGSGNDTQMEVFRLQELLV